MIHLKLLTLLLGSVLALAQDCDWDGSVDPDQGLDPDSLSRGAQLLGGPAEARGPESCRAACCADPACDLALLGLPADGPARCQLFRCGDGYEACALKPSRQFKVYRKTVKKVAEREAQEGGQTKHIEPLMEGWEPRSNQSNYIRCRLPMKVGSCRAAFPRFFYNVTSESCSSFIYGGCEANGNNFESVEECQATCRGVTGPVLPDESTPAPPPAKAPRMAPADPAESDPESAESTQLQKSEMTTDEYAEYCQAEPKVGPCRAALKHWYYNKNTGSCETFIYGGCRGNKNNYLTEESCKKTCTVSVLPSSKKVNDDHDRDSSDNKGPCSATPDPGPCRAAFSMFYYDPDSASCQSFVYGGCRGNKNRYGTMEECMRSCSEGLMDSRGKTRNRWTAAFFLFVTLAAISALLLAALIIITLRRHRLSRHSSSISDKQGLLPEPGEQSSLYSLTIPESPKPDQKA